MSSGAIVMMVFAILVLWGGLAVAVLHLTRFKGPEPDRVRRDL